VHIASVIYLRSFKPQDTTATTTGIQLCVLHSTLRSMYVLYTYIHTCCKFLVASQSSSGARAAFLVRPNPFLIARLLDPLNQDFEFFCSPEAIISVACHRSEWLYNVSFNTGQLIHSQRLCILVPDWHISKMWRYINLLYYNSEYPQVDTIIYPSSTSTHPTLREDELKTHFVSIQQQLSVGTQANQILTSLRHNNAEISLKLRDIHNMMEFRIRC